MIADRFDNRKTVIVTQSVQMALSAVLAIDALIGHATAWHVYAIAALTGTALVLDAPARQSLTFQMVGRDELPNAVALNSSLFNIARIAGPALGGVVIAAVGVGWCFAANAVSFLAVLASLLLMRPSEFFSRRAAQAADVLARDARRPLLRAALAQRARDPRDDGRLREPLLQLQHPAAGAREADARRRAAHVRRALGGVRLRRADRRAVWRPRSPARAGGRC